MNHLLKCIAVLIGGVGLFLLLEVVFAQESGPPSPQEHNIPDKMTNERLQEIIQRIDPEYTGRPGLWQLKVANIGIRIITDTNADRMRIIIPIREAEELSPEEMYRILQANYDTALDARYAIGQGVLWSTFIHRLSSLNDKDFLSGLGQSINIVATYGKSYSSGAFTYGGGDSGELLEKKLLEELMKKGEII